MYNDMTIVAESTVGRSSMRLVSITIRTFRYSPNFASLNSYFRTSWMALVVSMVKLENVNIHGFIHGGALNHPINRVDDRRIGSRTVRTHVLPSLKTNETMSHTSVG